MKFAPLLGASIGLAGAAVYWLSVQVWPTSVAVILAMAATTMATHVARRAAEPASLLLNHIDLSVQILYLLIKYNALMALSAAKLPFVAPAEAALGLIMICGYAASEALVVSMVNVNPGDASVKLTNTDLGLTLLAGFAPAVVLGIPGLTGLVAAILICLGVTAYLKISGNSRTILPPTITQQLTEVAFYLGALATWSYV